MTARDQAPGLTKIEERQQEFWTSDDYARISNNLVLIGELLCEAVDVYVGVKQLNLNGLPFDLGERAQPQPARKSPPEVARPFEDNPLGPNRARRFEVSDPNLGHRHGVGTHGEIHAEAGIGQAQIRLGPVKDQPPGAFALRRVPETEADHDAPVGQPVDVDVAAHVPHQERGVGILRGDLSPHPPLAPHPHQLYPGPEFLAGLGEAVLVSPAVRTRPPLDDAVSLEGLEPLAQERRRHQGNTALDIVEAAAVRQELPDHHRRPPLGEQLGGLGYGAELAVCPHDTFTVADFAGHVYFIS